MITDPLFYLLALPAVIMLGLGKGGLAGLGMTAMPMLALFVPPLQAGAILMPILIVQDVISVWVYRKHWSAWNLKVLCSGALVGVALAWALAAYVSDAQVRVAVGLIGVTFCIYTWVGAWLGRMPATASRPSAPMGVFWGALSGFTSMLAQAGSPPFQIHMLPQRLDRLTFVGTHMLFFGSVNAFKIVPFFALGQFSPANLATSAALLPVAIVANFFGIWLVRRIPTELFYKIAYVLVFLISLELIRGGVTALMQA